MSITTYYFLEVSTLKDIQLENLTCMVMSSPSAKRAASAPFDKSSADVILRSSENIDFHVHKLIISLASLFFEGVFSVPQSSSTQDSLEEAPDKPPDVVDMVEDRETLDCLLRYCCPVKNPSFPKVAVDSVLAAAMKYDLEVAAALAREALGAQASAHPLKVYMIACAYNCEWLATRAAKCWKKPKAAQAGLPEHTPRFEDTLADLSYIPEMAECISSGCFFRLL